MAPKQREASSRGKSISPPASKAKGGKKLTPRRNGSLSPKKNGSKENPQSSPVGMAPGGDSGAVKDEPINGASLEELLSAATKPLKAQAEELQAKSQQIVQRLAALGVVVDQPDPSAAMAAGGADWSAGHGDGPAAAEALDGAAPSVKIADDKRFRRKSIGLWRDIAGEHLSQMASSLEGAVAQQEAGDDDKLRRLFEKIDLDAGGTISVSELQAAIRGAGKTLTEEQVEQMLKVADEDGNDEVDFEEFVDILRGGVRATKAARAIQVHVHRSFRKKRMSKELGGAALGAAAVLADKSNVGSMSSAELDRLLGRALLSQKANLKELIVAWDRGHKGSISRMEFRKGLREDMGLRALDGKTIDGWFDNMDKDGGGTLDLSELKLALAEIERSSEAEQKEVEENRVQLATLAAQARHVSETEASMKAAMTPVLTSAAALEAFRDVNAHIDALVGARLLSKMKLEKLNDTRSLVNDWDLHRANSGQLWMDRDEFVQLVAEVLTSYPDPPGGDLISSGAAARRGLGGASGGAAAGARGPAGARGAATIGGASSGSVGGGVGRAAAGGGSAAGKDQLKEMAQVVARPSNPLGLGSNKKLKEDGGKRRKMTEAELAATKAKSLELLQNAGVSVERVEELFDQTYEEQHAATGEAKGCVFVQPVVQAMVQAEPVRKEQEDAMARACLEARRAAIEALDSLRDALDVKLRTTAMEAQRSTTEMELEVESTDLLPPEPTVTELSSPPLAVE